MWGRSKDKKRSDQSGGEDEGEVKREVKKGLYSADCVRPTPGTLPSSKAGFLVSFLVDARGGAMTGHRHWGMRVIIPPGAVDQPTRVQCRYSQLQQVPFPPPFMEREALASRVITMSPAGDRFKSPVLIEIPHFASSAKAEREIIVLRSDDGETWYEHVSDKVENGEIYQDVVTSVVTKQDDDLERIYDVLEVTKGRVIRILTSVFPKYFAVITRVREEVRSVGPDGGKVVLPQDPKLRATFPKNALYKKIKVGLQVQSLRPEIVQAAFGRSVEVSKMIAVEPRKRKFHQPIFVSIPLPCSPSKINENTDIRLLCSVTGPTEKAVWQDMTNSTPLELCKDVVHFSTKVSALFWIVVIHDKQREPESALTLANRLYEESILIPYLARFSVFYRENFPKAWMHTIRVYCMTDDKAEKVIRHLEGFRPLCVSGDVEVTHGSNLAVKVSGNVLQYKQDPFTGEFLAVSTIRSNEIKEPFVFNAFEDNNMTLFVQPRDQNTPMSGCLSFFRKLEHISAKQQIPLGEMNFDVSSGDTSFVIKDQTSWTPAENGSDTNGHGFVPNVAKTSAAKKSFNTIEEEEDPYEKIEIKREEEETVAEKNDENGKELAISENKEKDKKDKERKKPPKKPKAGNVESKKNVRTTEKSEKSKAESEIDSKANIPKITQVENKKNVEEIIPLEGEVTEARNGKDIISESEEVNINSSCDIKDQNLCDVSSGDERKESEEKLSIVKQAERINVEDCIHQISLAVDCQICEDNIPKSGGSTTVQNDKTNGITKIENEPSTSDNKEKDDIGTENTSNDCEINGEKEKNGEDLREENEVKISEKGINDNDGVINADTSSKENKKTKAQTKPPVNKKEGNKKKEKKKTKEFKDRDLEELRSKFARSQGVKEVVSADKNPVNPVKEDVALKSESSQVETKVEEPKGRRAEEEESLYEPVGEEREEFVKKRLNQASQKEESPVVVADHDIIGFDLNTNSKEELSEDPPKLPERRKNSKQNSTTKLSPEEKVNDKEKKSSFIKEWQKDLKDFFTLRKKKKSNSSPEDSSVGEKVEAKAEANTSVKEEKEVNGEEKPLTCNNEQPEGEIEARPNIEETAEASPPVQQVEKRTKKRREKRKTNSEVPQTNPFKAEASPEEDHKPRVVVPSPTGIPRPLPLNKKPNRDSLISEDDDLNREPSTNKNIEDTEEFKKAVDTFDEIFQSETGDQSPESKRLSKKLETSPNVNWKRIKTSRSVEAEETVQLVTESQSSEVSFSEVVTTQSSEGEVKQKISLLGDQYSPGREEVISPDLLKNVDGPTKQRKGSSRLSKKQSRRSKSPADGAGASYSECEDLSESEEKKGSDLTSRLEDTNVRMRKISDLFNTCEGSYNDSTAGEEESDSNISFHSKTRTPKVVVGRLVLKEEVIRATSETSVSDPCPVVYRAVVTQKIETEEMDQC